jgi:thiosulfate dehydrogenase [quinone] large subunit
MSTPTTPRTGPQKRTTSTVPVIDLDHPHRSDPPPAAVEAKRPTRALDIMLGAARLSIGFIFAWAFLDKTFGLGHDTVSKSAWIHGGSPTTGFLGHATAGPLAGAYGHLAGHAWADWLFMVGLAGIGAALMLGIGMRIAAAAGALMLVLMWSAVLPPANNPFMDEHLIYAIVLVALALARAGAPLGLGARWAKLSVVRNHSWLV